MARVRWSREAAAHLSRVDPTMASLVKRFGPPAIDVPQRRSPFEALARAIAHQQLNGRAAETIYNRYAIAMGDHTDPGALLGLSDETLRACGFSRAKSLALRDLAEKATAGVVPARAVLTKLDDEAIVERLVEVRGVGRWTVEMLLIFTLGRPDVLPVDDFGVQNGFRIAYHKRSRPKPKVLATFGKRWAPFRSAAAHYLWKAADDKTAT